MNNNLMNKLISLYYTLISIFIFTIVLNNEKDNIKFIDNNEKPFISKIYQEKLQRKKVLVAIIDTGVQYDHPYLKDNIVNSKKQNANNFDYGVEFSDEEMNTQPNDTEGHGTHIAGIIKSINPQVSFLNIKFYKSNHDRKSGLDSLVRSFDFAIEKNVDIINFSGGGTIPSSKERIIIEKAREKGILVIVASGNEGLNLDSEEKYYPANYLSDNLISVNGLVNNKVMKSSNYGRSVDISAPGFRIKSSIPRSEFGYMTGTSQATAFVTGVASLILSQQPELKYNEIKNIILTTATKQGNKSKYGILNADEAIKKSIRVNSLRLSIASK